MGAKQAKIHARLIARELVLCSARPISTPGDIDGQPEENDETEMTSKDASKNRRLVARLSYIAQNRTAIQRAAKGICRHMADPRCGRVEALKRTARYMVQNERLVTKYEPHRAEGKTMLITSYADADYAGRRTPRQGTYGDVQ